MEQKMKQNLVPAWIIISFVIGGLIGVLYCQSTHQYKPDTANASYKDTAKQTEAISKLKNEKINLEEQKTSAEKERDSLRKNLDSLQKLLSNAKNPTNKNDLQQQIQRLEDKLKAKDKQIAELTTQIVGLSKYQNEALQSKAELQKLKSKHNTELKDKDEEIKKIQDKLKEKEQEAEESKKYKNDAEMLKKLRDTSYIRSVDVKVKFKNGIIISPKVGQPFVNTQYASDVEKITIYLTLNSFLYKKRNSKNTIYVIAMDDKKRVYNEHSDKIIKKRRMYYTEKESVSNKQDFYMIELTQRKHFKKSKLKSGLNTIIVKSEDEILPPHLFEFSLK